ncbi:MAG: sigma-70 family RNA polymerase sigma factor [Pedobacter sp.]|uniref:RNA polymerase sigma factor n=1 Tax=Pedobacter sp. TaxID=1411316 RepID=UPI00356B2CC6
MRDYKKYSDQELTILLKDGDEPAFVELYNRYKLRILGNLVKLLRSEDLALELSQDLFLKIWDTRKQLDPEKSFRSYIFRISENMVMDFFRRVARDKKLQAQMILTQSALYSHIEENLIQAQESKRFEQVIAMLPPQRKQVFTLCKLEGKSYQEVSGLLGISTSTVSDHLLKANRFLKAKINNNSPLAISAFALAVIDGIGR